MAYVGKTGDMCKREGEYIGACCGVHTISIQVGEIFPVCPKGCSEFIDGPASSLEWTLVETVLIEDNVPKSY